VRIGAAGAAAGVSARTLRYYEQRGLLPPARRSEGGLRSYDAADVARVLRIRELAEVLGSDLDEIAAVLQAEDRLAELRQARDQLGPSPDPRRRLELLAEAERINAGLQDQVRGRVQRLSAMLDELERTAARYTRLRADLQAGRPPEGDQTPAGGGGQAPAPVSASPEDGLAGA
jgi:DNA-binding transcriptional MerR regulator